MTSKPAYILIPLIACLFSLAGCNTIEGAGEDIESVGEEIDEEVD